MEKAQELEHLIADAWMQCQYGKPAHEGDSPSRGGFPLKRGTVPLKRVLFTLHHDLQKKEPKLQKATMMSRMCPLSMHQFIEISICALEEKKFKHFDVERNCVKLCSLYPLAYQKKNRPIASGGVVVYGN